MSIVVDARFSPSRAAMLGVVLLVPVGVFLAANLLNEVGVGFLYAFIDPLFSGPVAHQVSNIVSPVVFLGGICGALVLNALAITRLDLDWGQERFVSTVTVEPHLPNLALIAAGSLMLVTLLGYAVVENFAIVTTHVG